MAYLRVRRVKGAAYYYVLRSNRSGARVSSTIVEYLGRAPARGKLIEACQRWDVKLKPGVIDALMTARKKKGA